MENLELLKEKDIYSLLLFIIYALKDVPECKILSNLAFLLDTDSLLNLLQYFGGTTITIPTTAELSVIAKCVYLYKLVILDKIDLSNALLKINFISEQEKTDVLNIFNNVCLILKDFIG